MDIDLQHSAIGVADSLHLLRALQAANPQVTPIVRLPCYEVNLIQQSFDAGFAGLIIPLVKSADEARKLVQATYYPPMGDRSFAASTRASLYDLGVDSVNQRMILLPQIESKRGLDNTENIVTVDGVTGLLFGPADLSLSCAWAGEDLWSYQPFLNAVRTVVTACHNKGKLVAILTSEFEPARDMDFRHHRVWRWRSRGAR